jgi:hypothetical protein
MTSILADRQYTLHNYKELEKLNISQELSDEIIQKINKLAKRVGAPSYQKTPVFKRNHYNKKIPKKENISAADWETIRNFKKTTLQKHTEGIEALMDKIRSCLNKLTDKTYDTMLDDIKCIMKEINKENASSFEKIGEAIFEIGSFNKFWAALYARLYKDLIISFPFMKDICIKNFQSFQSIFTNINYIDAAVDYNLFCEYNKENEKRRALSNFFVICASYDIIDKKEMKNIIVSFIKQVKDEIKQENKINHVEEITQNIGIMVISGKSFLKRLPDYNLICDEIKNFSTMNPKSYPSLTNKIVFKFMDLDDELDD